MARASFLERNDAYYSLRQAIRDEYEITLDLMSRDGDPASLKWLSMTGACLGLLALWSGLGEGPTSAPQAGAGPVMVTPPKVRTTSWR